MFRTQFGGALPLHAFFANATKAIKMVDEANAITRTLKKDTRLIFELNMESPVLGFGHGSIQLPHFIVRVSNEVPRAVQLWDIVREKYSKRRKGFMAVKNMVDQLGFANPLARDRERAGRQVLCVWSWHMFMDRLNVMRTAFADWKVDPDSWHDNLHFNPWMEYGPAEMMNKAMDVQHQMRELQAEIEDLEHECEHEEHLLAQEEAELMTLQMAPPLELSAVPEPQPIAEGLSRSPRSTLQRCSELIKGNKDLIETLCKNAGVAA